MKESSSYSLQKLPRWHPLREYSARLVGQEGPTCTVSGEAIGLQVSVGRYTLLATSYDYFDGCHHWIYLLGECGYPIDQLQMPDEFGFIQEVELVSGSEIAFGYYGTNDKWNLVVTPSGFWSFSPEALLRRLNRFLLAKRYLSVRRTKGPPWFSSQPLAAAVPEQPPEAP